jgi:hypothetical protein
MINFLLILLKSGIPIAATSFGLVWWALRKDYLGGAQSLDEYEQWTKAENQNRKAEKQRRKQAKRNPEPVTDELQSVTEDPQPTRKKFDPLHSKWMEFGGGFYGVVAFFTYVVVELGEFRDFFANFSDLFRGELVSMIVQFFVESLKNFVTAIAWPAYWLQRIHSEQWLWVIGAYGGYWLGARAAFRFRQNRTD